MATDESPDMDASEELLASERWVAEVSAAYATGGYAAGDGPAAPLDQMQWLLNERSRLRALVDVLLPVARLYVDAFDEDEAMTLPERLRLQQVEDVLADPERWTPDAPIGGAGSETIREGD